MKAQLSISRPSFGCGKEAIEELLKSDDWLFLNSTFECWKLDEILEQVLKS